MRVRTSPPLALHLLYPRITTHLFSKLQETLHKHTGDIADNSIETVEDSLASTDAQETSQGGRGFLQLFKNWPLMSAIILYSIFSLEDVAYSEVKLQDIYCLIFLHSSTVSVLYLIQESLADIFSLGCQ